MANSPHRYWKLQFNQHSVVSEIELRTVAGGADVTTPGTTISSRSTWAGMPVSYAIDNAPGTNHASLTTSDEWILIDFGAGNAKDIVQVAITARTDMTPAAGSTPGSGLLRILHSDDGVAFTVRSPDYSGFSYTLGQQRLFDVTAEMVDASGTGEATGDVSLDLGLQQNIPAQGDATGEGVGTLGQEHGLPVVGDVAGDGGVTFEVIPRPPPPSTATRLPLDNHVLGYWGFDEANVTDPALDETAFERNLTVSDAVSVIPARLGNGRQFNGTTSKALLTNVGHDSIFGLGSGHPLTIICWVTLDSVLQTGSRRRTVIAFEGAGEGSADHTLYGISVLNDGSIRYEHQSDGGGWVELGTAPGQLRAGRYYSLALVREVITTMNPTDPDALPVFTSRVRLYLNNVEVPWVLVTYLGTPTEPTNLPVPSNDGLNGRLCIGHSLKRADAHWHGIVDELSIHKVARKKTPYLDSAYYRLTLSTSFTKLTAQGDIRTVGGVDMGGGTRWWCYERDRSLYVIRENSLGLFTREVKLTTGANYPVTGGEATWLQPGGGEMPRLAYDPATDVLLVVFLAGGRVLKITAASGDVAETQNVTVTTDTTTKILADKSADLVRLTQREGLNGPQNTGDEGVQAAAAHFWHRPSFGVVITGTNVYGYALVKTSGGAWVEVGRAISKYPDPHRDIFFIPYPQQRSMADTFTVLPIRQSGRLSSSRLARDVRDWMGNFSPDYNAPTWNKDADAGVDEFAPRVAGGPNETTFEPSFTMTLPVKIALTDTWLPRQGGGPDNVPFDYTFTFTFPVKAALVDTFRVPIPGEGIALSVMSAGVAL